MLDSVEVLMQTIQDKRQKLLRVVLVRSRELVRERDDLFLRSVSPAPAPETIRLDSPGT